MPKDTAISALRRAADELRTNVSRTINPPPAPPEKARPVNASGGWAPLRKGHDLDDEEMLAAGQLALATATPPTRSPHAAFGSPSRETPQAELDARDAAVMRRINGR